MQIINAELARRTLGQKNASLKFILNDTAVVFFPSTQQHRDVKTTHLSYEDHYQGNAAAGLLIDGRVEIRFHSRYSEARIRSIWSSIQASSEFAGVNLGTLFYRGRKLL